MKKIFVIFVFLAFLVGCKFHDWPDSQDTYFKIVENNICDGVTFPGEMVAIKTSYAYVDISVSGGAFVNSEKALTIGPNGTWWIWIDVSDMSAGETFEISINEETSVCMVLE